MSIIDFVKKILKSIHIKKLYVHIMYFFIMYLLKAVYSDVQLRNYSFEC